MFVYRWKIAPENRGIFWGDKLLYRRFKASAEAIARAF
jgi:hypothetical protein